MSHVRRIRSAHLQRPDGVAGLCAGTARASGSGAHRQPCGRKQPGRREGAARGARRDQRPNHDPGRRDWRRCRRDPGISAGVARRRKSSQAHPRGDRGGRSGRCRLVASPCRAGRPLSRSAGRVSAGARCRSRRSARPCPRGADWRPGRVGQDSRRRGGLRRRSAAVALSGDRLVGRRRPCPAARQPGQPRGDAGAGARHSDGRAARSTAR